MALELIITSVRKGLDGGSGYQPVLRTKDLKPAIAERLQLRSGYSHPFPHGDRRNPVVFVHRIERVAGETLHVIARICDAGSDHTGRSNFLAHFVAMSDAEARKKAAGPAEVTRRMAFKTTWDEPAREAGPPTVVGGDRQPGACRAWEAAGLDPGIAGDLAAAAMAGREVTLVSRETDDVLALFADAMALVSPIKRWQVSFNTCRIEPFEGTWQAIRADLPHAKEARSLAGVIDLTANPRGGDGPYAAYARGNATALPWQEAANPVASLGERTGEKVRAGQTPPVEARASGSSRPPAAVMAPASPGAPPRPKRRPGIDRREELPSPKASDGIATGRLLLWLALAMIVIAPLAFGLTVLLRPELLPAWAKGTSVAVLPPETSNGPLPSEDRGDSERLRREREEKKRAEQSHREQEEQKKKDAEEIARAAEKELARQKEQQRQAAAQASADAEKAEANRKKAAFEALKKLPESLPKDLVSYEGGELRIVPDVELGPLDVDQLLNLEFSLAIPKEDIDGKPFKASVMPSEGNTWKIMAKGTTLDGNEKHLATLSVRDRKLHLRAADNNDATHPQFNLLRRSVLLVKACDPERSAQQPALQQAIQLIRPAQDKLQWPVSLSYLKPREEKLPRPKGTKLPQDIKITYQVRFPFPMEFKDGRPLSSPEVYRCEGTRFCPLLYCPPPDRNKPNERPVIGISVEIDGANGLIVTQPKVEGIGRESIDLQLVSDIAAQSSDIAAQSDETFDKVFKARVADQWDDTVGRLSRMAVQSCIEGNEIKKRVWDFNTLNRVQCEEFLEGKNWFPPRTDKDGKLVDKNTRLDRWKIRCEEIVTRAGIADKTSDAIGLRNAQLEWRNECVSKMREWVEHRKQSYKEALKLQRRLLAPINGEVTIEIISLESSAVDDSNNQYRVILAKPGPGKQPHGTTSPDTSKSLE